MRANRALGRIIVALQMALCVVLLVGAGLLIRTLRNLENTPLGMKVDGPGRLRSEAKHSVASGGQGFLQEPDEQAARSARRGIGDRHGGAHWVGVVGQQRHAGGRQIAGRGQRRVRERCAATWWGRISFTTLGVPVLAGRDFADSDTATSPHVGIINEEFAKRFLPNQNPLGHMIGTDDGRYTMTIVGVVKDHKYRSIDEEPIPMAWYEYAQIPVVGRDGCGDARAWRAAGDSAGGAQGGAADGSRTCR